MKIIVVEMMSNVHQKLKGSLILCRTHIDVPAVRIVFFDLIMLPLLPIWLRFHIMMSLCQHMFGKGIDERVDPGTVSAGTDPAGTDPTSALWPMDLTASHGLSLALLHF